MTKEKVLVIGASEKPDRYSNIASKMLLAYGHDIYAFGIKNGKIDHIEINTEWPINLLFDTVTLYIGPNHQDSYYQKIIDLKPKRVIFNPGTENVFFEDLLTENGIEAIEACTLVMLRTGQF